MSSTRIQLNSYELSLLESLLAPRVSDPDDVKLLLKIQKGLVAVGGKPSESSNRASNLTHTINDNAWLEEISIRMLSDNPAFTEADKEKYFNLTGIEI